MTTELMVPGVKREQIVALEKTAAECRSAISKTQAGFDRSFAMAAAIKQLGELVTEEMLAGIQALEGTPLGFNSDKAGKGGYDPETVKTAFIEATLRGFLPINNEWAIIAGRFYGQKNGFVRLVMEFEGLEAFEHALGVPEIQRGGWALVPAVARWRIDGKEYRIERTIKTHQGKPFDDRIPVRVNEGMGHDAIHGKAKRKLFASVHERLTGQPTPEGEADGDVIDVDSTEGGSHVQRSSLFDKQEPAPEADPAEQDAIIAEYDSKLASCESARHVGTIAKQAGSDERLTQASRTEVMQLCTEKRKSF